VVHARRPQVSRKSDSGLEFAGFEVFDQLAAGVQLPVVRYAEDTEKRAAAVQAERGRASGGYSPLVLIGSRELLEDAFEIVRVLWSVLHLNAGLIEQVFSIGDSRPDRCSR
jgi:hypothetical protein